jgi:hypothetical protein
MGRTPNPDDRVLRRRCDEVLHYIWDPIGVVGAPAARDEYESYLPRVLQLLHGGSGMDEIAEYLVEVETERMGLPGDVGRARNAAEILIEWRRSITGDRS